MTCSYKAYFTILQFGLQVSGNQSLYASCVRLRPGRVTQSVGHLTCKSRILGSIPGLATHTFLSPSPFSRRAVVSYWRKYVHEVLVNRLGGLRLPRKSVVRLTARKSVVSAKASLIFSTKNISVFGFKVIKHLTS